eukprot:snap_masked-scaffold_6-processed-gene-3.24-mRNA-1 protein AED:1.00 eAED:1.00 QI:0/0/0/0/1/1/2/0/389
MTSKLKENLFQFKEGGEDTNLQWSILLGLTFPLYVTFLVQNWRHIEFYKFKSRILAHLCYTFFNSVVGIFESLFYSKQIASQEIDPSPVIILGHFRSGTTLVHNLLSLDEENFSYPTTFQCANPSTFFLLENVRHIMQRSLKATRPMDNMALGFHLPQEDDVGLIALSHTSPFSFFSLPSAFGKIRKLYNLENHPEEKKKWMNSLNFFLKKVTLQNTTLKKSKRLALKSPLHTTRVEVLNEIFPEAKYIFIVRNPYDVFKSMRHFVESTFIHWFLETPSDEDLLEFILTQYEIFMRKYLKAKQDGILVEGKNLVELKFEELSKEKVQNMKHIYDVFKIPNWKKMEKMVELEQQKLRTYRKNSLKDLTPELKDLVYDRWKIVFDSFDYPK